MHEFGLCEGIVETVRKRAAGRPVRRVQVRIGVRHAAFAEPMAQAFELIAAGTEAAGATLEIVAVPVRLTCQDCHASEETADLLAVCPACGGDQVDLDGGDELALVEIEYMPQAAEGQDPAGTVSADQGHPADTSSASLDFAAAHVERPADTAPATRDLAPADAERG